MFTYMYSLSSPLPPSQPVLEEVIGRVREGLCSAVVVNAIINSFQPKFISQRALMFADLIKDCEETGLPKVHTHTLKGDTPLIIRTLVMIPATYIER